MPDFVPLQTALRELGVCRNTLARRLRDKDIGVYADPKDSRRLLIRRADFERLQRPEYIGVGRRSMSAVRHV